jgi:hypothetical protein
MVRVQVLTAASMKMTVFWHVTPVGWQILTDISEELTASIIALMMVAASTSETSGSLYQTTRRNILEVIVRKSNFFDDCVSGASLFNDFSIVFFPS